MTSVLQPVGVIAHDCLILPWRTLRLLILSHLLGLWCTTPVWWLLCRAWMHVPYCICCTEWMWSWAWWRAAMGLRVDSDDGCIYVQVGLHMHHCRSSAINSTYCVIKMHSDCPVLVTTWLLQLIFPKGSRWHMLWQLSQPINHPPLKCSWVPHLLSINITWYTNI